MMTPSKPPSPLPGVAMAAAPLRPSRRRRHCGLTVSAVAAGRPCGQGRFWRYAAAWPCRRWLLLLYHCVRDTGFGRLSRRRCSPLVAHPPFCPPSTGGAPHSELPTIEGSTRTRHHSATPLNVIRQDVSNALCETVCLGQLQLQN